MKFTVEDITQHPAAKIEPKDIYATLWRCRDFELSHLWQRSVFLTAFLVLVYTGYGICVFSQISLNENVSTERYTKMTLISLIILFVGMILSQLWIMMGKASKAWYERYEMAIFNLEHDGQFAQPAVTNTMMNKNFMHGNLPLPRNCNRNLFTTDAGAFSPSRINIFIGQLSWIILMMTFVGHSTLSVFTGRLKTYGYEPCCLILYAFLIVLVLNIVFYYLIRQMVTSKTLLEG